MLAMSSEAHRDGAGQRDQFATARRMVIHQRNRRAQSASAAAANREIPLHELGLTLEEELEEGRRRGREFERIHGRPREEV